MKMNAYIAGVGMVPFGKHLDKTLKRLAGQAIELALADAGLDKSQLQAAWMGNAAAGVVTGQEMIRGQVVLRGLGIGRIPVVNVENACASSSTAFQQACAMVSAGCYDVALVCGYEKLFHEDKARSLGAFSSAVDVEDPDGAVNVVKKLAEAIGEPFDAAGAGSSRSVFMDIYAMMAKKHMKRHGSTARHFAMIAAKNSIHGSLNPRAQFQERLTIDEVLAARAIIDPLTLPMCSPIGDGAAAVIVVSERKARQLGLRNPVRVAASALVSGWDFEHEDDSVGAHAAQLAYAAAGLGPQDLSCIELHDASAPSELVAYEYLGLCPPGGGAALLETGATGLGGRIPVNTSGGLLRKGHPVGASGCAQIVELTEQLQGRAGARQVSGARVGLAHNGGGAIGLDAAATVVSLLVREDLR
ncbi:MULTISPECIES: thiolase family protein [unclassified Pseudomonas]|uniref:thiolase family protein n=1 Tax=unclassified Pseudomonas TaxID=196821 RepID=UPI002446CAF9|nr:MULTISPECIES: thiolase family protein [unclassified Pseudomonas]MDH0897001.1 thiolase family protein [Pseudomonas sp. GD03875]MDH1064251.1 thiolase family protein [Pseudomonas sp. GD03985]